MPTADHVGRSSTAHRGYADGGRSDPKAGGAYSRSVHNSLEFTRDDLPRDLTQPEVVAAKVREMFDGQNPIKIADVARALHANYGTCKTHIYRAATMGLLALVDRKGFLPVDESRQSKW